MKVLVFSHGADIDGMGGVILAKMSFSQLDYVFANNTSDLGSIMQDYLESYKIYKYDIVFVTDLAIPKPVLDEIAMNSILRNKIQVFDHHKTSIENGFGEYDFTHIVVEDELGKRCGTDLFYEYLKNNGLIKPNEAIDEFVELTRLVDTWEWKNAGDRGARASDLAVLFNAIGKDNYIFSMIQKLCTNKMELNEKEDAIVKMKRLQYKKMIASLWNDRFYFSDEFGNPYAILYANHEYVGELCEYVRSIKDEFIKYFICVDLDKGEYGQKSYRNVDQTFDVSVIANAHGGGGHSGAAGVNITSEQRRIAKNLPKDEALKYLADSKYENEKTK